ncbi:MAG TPA: serine/threonine-protein kinase, partial [Gemmatimonadales bacterium]
MTDAHDQLAAALADRYLVEEELGRGASATVYRARDLRHDRWVALKVLHPALGAALGVERFQREIRTQARLQHPHLLPLFDSGEAAGRLFYTMPYVADGSLRDRLAATSEGLPLGPVVQVAREVASALGYAHALGIVHRDLKPENIMFSPSGEAIVTDFGIAYAADRDARKAGKNTGRITERGAAIGTPLYMSPEQASGDDDVDGRADQYSLAVVLHEMLTGATPFTGRNARAILSKKLTETSPPVRQHRPDVPPEVETVLTRALSRHPADRYDTVEEFTSALADAATPLATPVPRPSRLASRSWRAMALGIALVAAAAVSLRLVRHDSPTPEKQGSKVLVVLPFKNLGPGADQYFADGLTEELTSRLAGLSGLRVISRTSADQYRTSAKS